MRTPRSVESASPTRSTRRRLALAYLGAGRVDDAIAIFEALLAHSERILGAEESLTRITRKDLALAYHAAGRIADAALLERQA